MAEPTRAPDGKFTKADAGGTAVLDAPKEKELTKDELSGLRLAHANLMGRKAEDEPTAEEQAAEAETAKAKADADAKVKTAVKPKTKPVAAVKPVAQPEPLTADAIGEAVAKRLQPKSEPEPKQEATAANLEDGLGDDEKETLATLKEMEALYPDRYKAGTITARFAEGQRKLNAYVAEWQKANPGQEFDIHAPEHAEFLDKNDVDWPDRDFKAAERSLLRKEVKGEIVKELAPKLSEIDEIKAREKLAQSHGVIKSEQVTGLRGYWSALDEKFADLVRADGSVDEAGFQAMLDADPETHKVMVDNSMMLNVEVGEARKLFADEGQQPLIKLDDKNPAHKFVLQFTDQLEAEMLAGPPEGQLDENGRQLVTPAAYANMTPVQRKNHWVIGFTEVRDALIVHRADIAKKAVESIEQRFLDRAKRRKLVADDTPTAAEPAQTPVRQPQRGMTFPPNRANIKPNSPGATGDSKLAAHTRANGNGGKNDDPTSLKAFLRR